MPPASVTLSVAPLRLSLPPTLTLSPVPAVWKFAPGAPKAKSIRLPCAAVKSPLTVSVPMESPGVTMPPDSTSTLPPIVPWPRSVAPPSTVTLPPSVAPLPALLPTTRVPALIVVPPL